MQEERTQCCTKFKKVFLRIVPAMLWLLNQNLCRDNSLVSRASNSFPVTEAHACQDNPDLTNGKNFVQSLLASAPRREPLYDVLYVHAP